MNNCIVLPQLEWRIDFILLVCLASYTMDSMFIAFCCDLLNNFESFLTFILCELKSCWFYKKNLVQVFDMMQCSA